MSPADRYERRQYKEAVMDKDMEKDLEQDLEERAQDALSESDAAVEIPTSDTEEAITEEAGEAADPEEAALEAAEQELTRSLVEDMEEILAGEEEPAEEPAEDPDRPVTRIDGVVEDPLAEGESTEDIYSGKYQRDTSDRGIYTGGTKNDRLMSNTLGDGENSREARRARRARARRRKKILTTIIVLLILAALGGLGYYAYDKGLISLPSGGGAKTETDTQAPETAAPETEAPETEAPETEAPEETGSVGWEKDTDPDVAALVRSYYTAVIAGDTAQLQTIVDPSVTIDESAVQSQSEMIESYEDVTTYVMDGANEGETAVYVTYGMKFRDIDTPAPGMVPAYVRTDDQGALRLLPYEYFDETVSTYMNGISLSQQVQDLSAMINEQYQAALASDEALNNFVTSMSSGQEAEESTEASQAASTDGSDITFTEVDDIRYTTTQVKCRKVPTLDNDTEDFVLLDPGVWVHVIGDSENWCKVVTQSGNTGYIYKQYLSVDKPGED